MDSNSITFDDLLPELKDNIFEYFHGKELLNLSLVCHAWYDHMAYSKMCMNKIKIKVRGKYRVISMENKELLKYSKRQYQRFDAGSCWKQMDNIIDILSGPGHPWRIVHFEDLKFITNQDFEKCLTGIEETIQELKFVNVGIHRPSSYRTDYFFPNLTVLKLHNCDWSLNEPFMYATQIRELYLSHYRPIDNIETFQRIMTLNANLKSLSLPVHCFDSLVQKEVTDGLTFQIRNLIVTNIVRPNEYGSSKSNLAYFLKSQTSIKKLEIEEWMGLEVLVTIFKHLRILEKLILMKIQECEENIDWKTLTLKPHYRLADLEYQDMKSNPDIFNTLVEAAENLKILDVFAITQVMLDKSIYKLQNLEHLAVGRLDIRQVTHKNILLKLKSIRCNAYDISLQTNLEKKTKARRSYFENILFDNSEGRVTDFYLYNFVRLER